MSSSNLENAPLLLSSISTSSSDSSESRRRSLRQQSLHQAARFLRQASGHGSMREPSVLVRETAAQHLEERQNDWAYSKPVVVIDVVWNIGFVLVGIFLGVLSLDERPDVPLRLWIFGYLLQCLLHVVCVVLEYRKRRQRRWRMEGEGEGRSRGNSGLSSPGGGYVSLSQFTEEGTSSDTAKQLGSVNTMFSFIWWLLGFYWVSDAGPHLIEQAPLLYWLCVVFLGLDVFFVVFFIALACVIGIAVCCCLPCIIAILYAVAEQEGASKEEVERLAKYTFRRVDNTEQKYSDGETKGPGGLMTECETETPNEHYLALEDAECCICLSAYDDGAELRELPCGHHFHSTCVDKWLFINATCPLCKYNITQSLSSSSQEV
ncbi:hypothetical protein LIER_23611 [Lithospermum erythrorhizon]|uniref:RING-type E3 ubiquitin transferase n=1 Tax=Lithospermum erythrorhizon TaxID=34254 RepID=A0AAV3R3U7_LITER